MNKILEESQYIYPKLLALVKKNNLLDKDCDIYFNYDDETKKVYIMTGVESYNKRYYTPFNIREEFKKLIEDLIDEKITNSYADCDETKIRNLVITYEQFSKLYMVLKIYN